MPHVLIVDADQHYGALLRSSIRQQGFQVTLAPSLVEGFRLGQVKDIDVVLLASPLAEGDAPANVQHFRDCPSAPEVIVLAKTGDAKEAELVINNGAWDYITKGSCRGTLVEALAQIAACREQQKFRAAHGSTAERIFPGIIGNSSRLRASLATLTQAANSDANVLLHGETGTGKEKFALALHQASQRGKHNFVVVDCAALPETLVESTLFGHERGAFTGATHSHSGLVKQADRGTLFLDEIGELPLATQKSFLRVLEERRFRPVGSQREVSSDFRLVAATNRNLEAMVAEGKFRSDLLFRLRTFAISLPALRERKGDIGALTTFFLDQFHSQRGIAKKKVSHPFLAALDRYEWPGNVRELRHALERSLAAAQDDPVLLAKHLPTNIRIKNAQLRLISNAQTPASDGIARRPIVAIGARLSDRALHEVRNEMIIEVENRYLRQLLANTNGRIKEACTISGLSRSRLYQLLKDHGIRPEAMHSS